MFDTKRTDASTWLGAASILMVGSLIYGWISSYALSITSFSDAMDYLFIADFYRSWLHGQPLDDAAEFYRITRFPPLYSLVLAAFGAGSDQQHLASIISAVTAVLAALAVFWWIKRERGDVLSATMIGLALLLYPAYFLLNLYPVSEPMAIGLLAVAFGLLATPKVSGSRLLVAALIIGITPLVRTAVLPVIPALLIWIVIHRPAMLSHRIIAMAAAATPITAWMAYRSILGSETYTDYLNAHQMLDALGGWPDALWVQPGRLFMAAVDTWGGSVNPLTLLATVVLTGFSAVGCALRMRAWKIDGWFLAGYIAMILIWPYPAEFGRFIVLVYPCLLLSALKAALVLDERLRAAPRGRSGATVALALILALASGATAVPYAVRASVKVDEALLGDKREGPFFHANSHEDALIFAELYGRVRLLIAEINTVIPEGACVYALMPQMLRLHGGVLSIPYPSGIAEHPDPENMLNRCEYYFIGGFHTMQLDYPPLHPWTFIKDWTNPVLVSDFEVNGGMRTAAALLERRRPDATESSSPAED